MKNLFNVKLVCPFCKKEIIYNTLSFKAKYECKHCGNDLIIRTKPMFSSIVSVIGFFIVFALMETLGISKLTVLPKLLFILVGCSVYLVITYALLNKLFNSKKIYVVDAEDPTYLKRYKKK